MACYGGDRPFLRHNARLLVHLQGVAMTSAVYPGTFDPLTRGHEDLVRRACGLFSEVIVGVADSRGKRPFFTTDERIRMARDVLAAYPNCKVFGFSGLL